MDSIALFDPVIARIGQFRKWLQENPHALASDSEIEIRQKQYEEENSISLQEVPQNRAYQVPEMPSVNIQDLHDITNMALQDYHESVNIVMTGDLEENNNQIVKKDGFYQERCKNYAVEISGIIDNMIIIEQYDISLFRNYKELVGLVLKTEGKDSATYLRRLISVARMVIPVMQKYIETSIVDAGITSKSNMEEAR